MTDVVTIVMYHYVRRFRYSRYPAIKGLATEAFEAQLGYITKFYNVISGPQLMAAITEGAALPPRPLLLTFDDGYIDHFTEVFPILDREKLPGCFFPSARCILEHTVLDVNKIHFVLASVPDKTPLVEYICARVDESRSRFDLHPSSTYWERFGKANRLDPAEVDFCKIMLQRELPPELRRDIVDELFRRHVSRDEASFSHELYMTLEQIRVLQQHGMYVGSHGYDHFWLNTLSADQQELEVDRSLRFLESVGSDVRRWIMCYPYGASNESLHAVLRARHCAVGLTTEVGLATCDRANALLMPRLDAIDLPVDANAPMNEWTARSASSERLLT